MNLAKKGLASSIVLIISVMVFFAFSSIFTLVMWNNFNDKVQGLSNTTVSPAVKEKIASLSSRLLWADKIFIGLFTCLLISFLISAITIPVERPIFLLLFFFFLVMLCIVAMGLSNSWAYVLQLSDFATASQDIPLINNFMRFMPIIIFLVGIMGAVLFYARKETNFSPSGPGDSFE